jgi:DNA-binding CsgD family transcriptional regulator
LALYAQALVESLRGEIDRAVALGTESLLLGEQAGSVQLQELARSALGFAELSRGEAGAAHGWLATVAEAMEERGPAHPGTLRFLPDELEALIGLGEIGRADQLLSPFERRAQRLACSWAIGAAARCRGLALAAGRELDGAVAAFDRAIAHQLHLGQPLELGRTYLVRGSVLRRAKKWASARESLNNAARIFERLGARVWLETTTSELGRIGGRATGLSTLTETESRVAELVATGLTNREVAARLFLSVSTIESNLRRAYQKLGVRSRTELSHKLSVPEGAKQG